MGLMFLARDEHDPSAGGSGPAVPLRHDARGTAEIVLDLSRLLARVLHSAPTGVDRVEMAYARGLLERIPERLLFGAIHPSGLYGRIPHAAVREFLDTISLRWETFGSHEPEIARRAAAFKSLWTMRPRPVTPAVKRRVVLQASHQHLDKQAKIAGKLGREHARFVCMLHDVIPLSHPEFARPDGAARHAARLDTLDRHASGIIVNSVATRESLVAQAPSRFGDRPIRVAHLGVQRAPAAGRAAQGTRPYFLCVGTIEPRKNHLLLLNIWRSMIEAIGVEQAPRLLLVGRRGSENEHVDALLDRCSHLREAVIELDRLPDLELRRLMGGARALLMPSFAEGFGLPIAEALAAGLPVIASDLPANREAGGRVPEYIDPIDGTAWRDAVLAYSAPRSNRREDQLSRLASWKPVQWSNHIEIALALAEEVAAC